MSVTSSAGQELLTTTQLDQNQAAHLAAEVKQAAADPVKAAALVSELGGAGLLRAVVLGSTIKDAGLADAVREAFQAGQPTLGKDVAGRIATELTAGLTVEDATQKANNTLALSFLLRDSTLNPELLIALAPGLIEIDQHITAEKKFLSNQNKTWTDITGAASPSFKTLFEGQDWAVASDVLASYLAALSRDGVAGLAVFTDTPLGTTTPQEKNYLSDTALTRQRYFMEQRSWSHDQFTALTAALDAAVTGENTANTPLAAGLTSSTVEMLANRARNSDTNGESLGHSDQERFTGGNISNRAAEHVMRIVGQHLAAVGYYVTPKQEITTTRPLTGLSAPLTIPGQDPHQAFPVFRRVDLTTVTASAATPDTIEQLRGYLDTYRDHTFTVIAHTYASESNHAKYKASEKAAQTDAALEALHARITPQQEDVRNSLGRLTKNLFTSKIITTQDIQNKANRYDIRAEKISKWFFNGDYPDEKMIREDSDLETIVLALREDYFDSVVYRTFYDLVLNA